MQEPLKPASTELSRLRVRAHGFSLVELLTAMAVSSLVLSGFWFVMQRTMMSNELALYVVTDYLDFETRNLQKIASNRKILDIRSITDNCAEVIQASGNSLISLSREFSDLENWQECTGNATNGWAPYSRGWLHKSSWPTIAWSRPTTRHCQLDLPSSGEILAISLSTQAAEIRTEPFRIATSASTQLTSKISVQVEYADRLASIPLTQALRIPLREAQIVCLVE